MGERLKQDKATSKSFPKMPNREPEERTVITITTDSQITDGEGDSIAAGENTEADEVTEIHAPPPTTITSRTLTAETPMPSSPIGSSTEISYRTNGRDFTATPTRPSDTITESPEGGKVYCSERGRVESVGEDVDKDLEKFPSENQNIRRSSRIRTAKRVEKMGGIIFLMTISWFRKGHDVSRTHHESIQEAQTGSTGEGWHQEIQRIVPLIPYPQKGKC